MQFDMLSADAIRSDRATDAYFERTTETLEFAGRNPRVVAEVTADQFSTGEFSVLNGVKDAVALLEGVPIDVDAVSEGRLFDGGPVMQITGKYLDFARFETSLLGFLSHASGVATRAVMARRAAPDTPIFSFGTRHVHPAIAPMIERSAILAGLDGFSHVAAGDVIGRSAGGTMPHSLVICFGPGEQEAAWRAFHEAVDPSVPRIALCDTYSDEKDESIRAAEALGDALESVRLDTTASRRGDFRHIVREVRWELDQRGFGDVGIFASGGLDADRLRDLSEYVDGFGVGGFISNADPLDFALDIVTVEGRPAAKRGKLSGGKQVYRTPDGRHVITEASEAGPEDGEALLEPVLRDGDIVGTFDLDEARKRCSTDADRVGFGDPDSVE